MFGKYIGKYKELEAKIKNIENRIFTEGKKASGSMFSMFIDWNFSPPKTLEERIEQLERERIIC